MSFCGCLESFSKSSEGNHKKETTEVQKMGQFHNFRASISYRETLSFQGEVERESVTFRLRSKEEVLSVVQFLETQILRKKQTEQELNITPREYRIAVQVSFKDSIQREWHTQCYSNCGQHAPLEELTNMYSSARAESVMEEQALEGLKSSPLG